MKRLALIAAVGAIIGSLLRYCVGLVVPHSDVLAWPWSTFAVNVVGAFIIGAIANVSSVMNNEQRRHFVITGMLGGFTTFSAFAVETIQLQGALAFAYVAATFFVGVCATHLGSKVVKS